MQAYIVEEQTGTLSKSDVKRCKIIMKKSVKLLYSVLGKIMYSLLRATKYFIKQYQTIKFDHYGDFCYLGSDCHFVGSDKIVIGNHVYIGNKCVFQTTHGKIVIGNHVMFGPGVNIHNGNHIYNKIGKFMDENTKPDDWDDGTIHIEDDVWIGANAVILGKVKIGEGSIVGAGSIVTHNVTPYTIVAGNPVQLLGYRFKEHDLKLHRQLIKERKN